MLTTMSDCELDVPVLRVVIIEDCIQRRVWKVNGFLICESSDVAKLM